MEAVMADLTSPHGYNFFFESDSPDPFLDLPLTKTWVCILFQLYTSCSLEKAKRTNPWHKFL